MSKYGNLPYSPLDKKDLKKTVEINPQLLSPHHRFDECHEDLFKADLDPTEDDVIQGGIGDCWFLATLCSILFLPRGPKFLKTMMRDLSDPVFSPVVTPKSKGLQEPPKIPTQRIVVRLYDANRQPHFISVPRAKVVDTEPKEIQGSTAVSAAYNKGGLWVSALEMAMTAFDKKLNFKPETAQFKHIEGNQPENALRALTGCSETSVTLNNIIDVMNPKDRTDVFRSDYLETMFLLNEFLNKAPDKQPSADVLAQKVFKGDKTKAANFAKWFYEAALPARTGFSSRPVPGKSKCQVFAETVLQSRIVKIDRDGENNEKKVVDYEVEKYLRREHVVDFLEAQNCPLELRTSIRDWLTEKKILPGKKYSTEHATADDAYTTYQLTIYKQLVSALASYRPTVLSTREFIGGAVSKGHSGAEDMYKGIVGNHAYALKSCGEVNWNGAKRYMVHIRNPWAKYGRQYTLQGSTYHAEDRLHAESWIELSDFTKRFLTFTIGPLPQK